MSWVDKLRDVVITCTWLLVISGTAPIGVCVKEKTPKPIIDAVKIKISSLFFKLNFIMFSNIIHK
tara:strand:- start:1656 stop:1850 length:195 start_codon:yes stop_codon:yes gene_type:complete